MSNDGPWDEPFSVDYARVLAHHILLINRRHMDKLLPRVSPGEQRILERWGEEIRADHGTIGGDRQVQDVGAVAYPSACWMCGGFDADV